MSSFSEWMFCFLTCSLISSILLRLLPKGIFQEIMKLLCGIFLTVSLLHPISKINLPDLLSNILFSGNSEPEAAITMGKDFSETLLAQRIKDATAEYILDKAASLGTDISAEVILSQEDIPIPVSAILTGDMEPAAKSRLEQYICAELGIAKEDIQWTQGSSAKREGN